MILVWLFSDSNFTMLFFFVVCSSNFLIAQFRFSSFMNLIPKFCDYIFCGFMIPIIQIHYLDLAILRFWFYNFTILVFTIVRLQFFISRFLQFLIHFEVFSFCDFLNFNSQFRDPNFMIFFILVLYSFIALNLRFLIQIFNFAKGVRTIKPNLNTS